MYAVTYGGYLCKISIFLGGIATILFVKFTIALLYIHLTFPRFYILHGRIIIIMYTEGVNKNYKE